MSHTKSHSQEILCIIFFQHCPQVPLQKKKSLLNMIIQQTVTLSEKHYHNIFLDHFQTWAASWKNNYPRISTHFQQKYPWNNRLISSIKHGHVFWNRQLFFTICVCSVSHMQWLKLWPMMSVTVSSKSTHRVSHSVMVSSIRDGSKPNNLLQLYYLLSVMGTS